MDEDVRMFLEQLSARLIAIENELKKLHTPGDCPVNDRVHTMELSAARQQGMITIVGAIAGMIAAALINAVIFIFSKR